MHGPVNVKFDTLVYLVGFIIEIYYDARPYERQIYVSVFTYFTTPPQLLRPHSEEVARSYDNAVSTAQATQN